MTGFRSCKNSTCTRVLNLLEAGYLRLREVVVKSYSNQVWSGRWRPYRLLWNQGKGMFTLKSIATAVQNAFLCVKF